MRAEKFGNRVQDLFLQKCKAKGIEFTGVEQIFPMDLAEVLKPHMKMGLTRVSSEPLPMLEEMIDELKTRLTKLLK